MIVHKNFDLTNYNSYRIRSECKEAIFPENEEEILEIFKSDEVDQKFIIGNGNNIILSKRKYDESFVILSGILNEVVINGEYIEAGCGVDMGHLSQEAQRNALSGLEIFYDIPSSLGGAIVMNAGAGAEEIKDLLIKVKYFDPKSNKFEYIEKKDLGFEYRNSLFQREKHLIILRGWLHLKKSDPESIQKKMNEVKEARWFKQPREFPNAGSVFKRPKGYYVGAIIDELKLKGFTIGGAKISEKHGGFIINFNEASGKDIIAIIDHVKQKVRQKFKIDLEVEQRIL